MKQIIKSSLLAILFLFILTAVSHAANKSATVSYGDLNSDGTMQITVTFPGDRDTQDSSYDGLFQLFDADGWTYPTERDSMTLTATNVNTKPFIKYYAGGPIDDGVTVKIATPYIMNVGDSFTFTGATIVSSSNESVVNFTNKTVNALSAGTSTLTLADTDTSGNDYTYQLAITVNSTDNGSGNNNNNGTDNNNNNDNNNDNNNNNNNNNDNNDNNNDNSNNGTNNDNNSNNNNDNNSSNNESSSNKDNESADNNNNSSKQESSNTDTNSKEKLPSKLAKTGEQHILLIIAGILAIVTLALYKKLKRA